MPCWICARRVFAAETVDCRIEGDTSLHFHHVRSRFLHMVAISALPRTKTDVGPEAYHFFEPTRSSPTEVSAQTG